MTGGHTSCRSRCSSSCFQAVSNAAASLMVLSNCGMNTQKDHLQRGRQGFKSVLLFSKVFVHTQSILFRALAGLALQMLVHGTLLHISKSSGTCSYSSHSRQTLQTPVKCGGGTFAVSNGLDWDFFLDIHST